MNSSSQLKSADQQSNRVKRDPGAKCKKFIGIFIFSFMAISVVFMVSARLRYPKLLGGLHLLGLDESSCLSRNQSFLYRKASPYKPSPHLISRLRKYEALHKQCGPYTESYNRAVKNLKSGKNINSSDCKYVIWTPEQGLGNRMLTLASSFLYALLTDRVLLIGHAANMPDLFCEPFPEVSWLLPSDFPLNFQLSKFKKNSTNSYGNLLKKNVFGNSKKSMLIPYVSIYVAGDYFDDKFFCDQDQMVLQHIPWLIIKSDLYFLPSLFLIPSFEQELVDLFPDKDTVFHHLGRYLFHPTDSVWGLITRYYESYLAEADEKIGIQVRVFENDPGLSKRVLDQIVGCTIKENLLPKTDEKQHIKKQSGEQRINKAVLMTSLTSNIFEELRNMYWQHSTVTGEKIAVYQPSHEEHQQTEQKMHDRKAWAEIYLLSLTDKLITSPWSTFGYVAQSLGGLKPWILYRPDENFDPPCHRGLSIEPCFHHGQSYRCEKKESNLAPHVRQCEDMNWGVKLFEKDN